MACEEEKIQVELLEILTELQAEAHALSETAEFLAELDARRACNNLNVLLLNLATGKVSPDDLGKECVEALERLVDKAIEHVQQYKLWLNANRALFEASNRYSNCLHKLETGIPSD